MSGTITVTEALKKNPEFFKNRPDDVNWTLNVNEEDGTKHKFIGADWEAISRFGCVRNVVVTDENGNPMFDRPDYWEAPNVNMIVWGRDHDGKIRLATLTEERPHADDPKNSNNTEALVFGQIPMGFIDKVFAKDDVKKFEDHLQGAVRETAEETGAIVIKNKTRPDYPHLFASPSFTRSTNQLYFIEVDLGVIKERAKEYGEKIYNAEFITVPELLRRIRIGSETVGDKEIIYRYGNSLAVYMIFFATYPEFFRF